jgi:hypothetical protein
MKKLLLFLLCPFILLAQTQIGQTISGDVPSGGFGNPVSLSSDGSRVAIGNTSSIVDGIRVFELQNNTWVQIGNTIIDSDETSFIELTLNNDGSRLAIGFVNAQNSKGIIKVLELQNEEWLQIGNDIIGDSNLDRLGGSLDFNNDGSILIVGVDGSDDNGQNSGQARIYRYLNNTWSQIGVNINGISAFDQFGNSVAINSDGNIVVIGARLSEGNNGHARVFQNQNDNWVQIGETIVGETLNLFGESVAINADGLTVIIGGTGNNANDIFQGGMVRVYQNQSGEWVQIGEDIQGLEEDDQFGKNVAISADGSIIAVATPRTDFNGTQSGSVDLFYNQNGNWTQLGNPLLGAFGLSFFGNDIGLSSDAKTLAVSADGQGTNSDEPGSVIVFDIPSAPLSIKDFQVSDVSLYPIPAKEKFTINLSGSIQLKQINIYNSLSQFLFSSKETTIDSSSLSTGLYFVEIETNQGKATKKLIIE